MQLITPKLTTPADVVLAHVSDVLCKEYNYNVQVKVTKTMTGRRDGGTTTRFVLRCENCREAGARLAPSGRRTNAATWDAHRVAFEALFEINPNARIITALAVYDGKDDFENKFRATFGKL